MSKSEDSNKRDEKLKRISSTLLEYVETFDDDAIEAIFASDIKPKSKFWILKKLYKHLKNTYESPDFLEDKQLEYKKYFVNAVGEKESKEFLAQLKNNTWNVSNHNTLPEIDFSQWIYDPNQSVVATYYNPTAIYPIQWTYDPNQQTVVTPWDIHIGGCDDTTIEDFE